jgi:DNA-binding winged helix-turn-helix (wHTH) protein
MSVQWRNLRAHGAGPARNRLLVLPMDELEFHFADCVLNAAHRELWRGGQRQDIEPKPFALLHYLIRHRERVVPHEELMAALWPTEDVSPGALARAVMLARRAVGDAGSDGVIRTMARVGYRFAAEVKTAAPDNGPIGLALLPFDNQTGDSQLDWAELGLMSLVARALAQEPRLSIPPVAQVLAALDTLPATAAVRERADALRRLLGVRQVVAVSIAGHGDQLELLARWLGDPALGAPPVAMTLNGVDALATTATGLARSLVEAMLPSGEAKAPAGGHALDPLAGEAMARAMQAAAEQRWTAAAHLLQVVLDFAPGNEGVQLELLRAQAALGAPAAQPLGQVLLDGARARSDELQIARVEQALGRACLNQGDYAAAQKHLSSALQAAGGKESADWIIQTLLWQSAAAIQRGHLDDARPPLDEAKRLCELSGNRIHALAALNMEAVMAAHQGHMVDSARLSREAMRRSRELRLHRYLIDASINLADDCIGLGLLHEAAESGEEGLAAAAGAADRYHLGAVCAAVCLAYSQLRRPGAAANALARVQQAGLGAAMGNDSELRCAIGHHSAAIGDHAAAADQLDAIIRLRSGPGGLLEIETAPWWLLYSLRAGRLDQVERELAGAQDDGSHFGAAREYLLAALSHARGDAALARDLLTEPIRRGIGPWSAFARMDGAWLAIEAGELAPARQALDGLGAWQHEHPVAQAVLARWHLAAGDAATALVYQRRYEAVVESPAGRALAEFGRWYERAAAGVAVSLPRAPWLPSLW